MKNLDVEVAKVKGLIRAIENICSDTRYNLASDNIKDVDNKLMVIYNYVEEIKEIAEGCIEKVDEDDYV